jgi:hypothetical protein
MKCMMLPKLTLSAILLGASVGGVVLVPTGALAQSSLATLSERAELSRDDIEQIKRLVDAAVAKLEAPDAIEVPRGRRELTGAFEGSKVAVPFRVEAGRLIVDRIRPLTKSQRELTAVNALIVAGETATRNSQTLVIEGLKDPRASVRIGAAYALSRFYLQATRSAPAFDAEDTDRGLKALEAMIASETDPMALDAAVTAMVAASGAPGGAAAAERMGQAVLARLAKGAEAGAGSAAGVDLFPLAARGVRELRQRLQDLAVRPAAESVGTARIAAALSGELLGVIRTRISTPEWTTLRDVYQAASATAETTLTLASTTLSGPSIGSMDLKLSDRLRDGDTAAFGREAQRVIDLVKRAPFAR